MKKLSLIFSLFFSSLSWSQIVFVSTNDTIDVDMTIDPAFFYYLDINQDGINDFEFQHTVTSSWSQLALGGLTDSSDIVHRYFYFPGNPSGSISGWQAINMTDSTLSSNSNWMADYSPIPPAGSGILHNTLGYYVSEFLNQNVYFGVRFFVEDDDFILKPHYACIDATLTLNDRFIIHGWYYQNEPNTPITCTESLLVDSSTLPEITNDQQKQVVRYVDMLGREVSKFSNTIIFAVYNDGSIQRIYQID
jgi:hypothetical protein